MTNNYSQAIFDNPEIWDSAVWQKRGGDLERARLAGEWLPREVHSILDVGCGNGVFTDLAEPNRVKVGLDMSRIALEHISAPRLRADATFLPFEDHSFDASLSMEMLEHLPFANYPKVLNELARVARKYILISVPYNEELKYTMVTCPKCLHSFHPYNHIRQYRLDDLRSMFGTLYRLNRLEGVVPTKRQAFPGIWNIYRVHQHRNGRNFPRTAVCPQCGYKADNNPSTAQSLSQVHRRRSSLSRLWPKRSTFTWWMALYRNEA